MQNEYEDASFYLFIIFVINDVRRSSSQEKSAILLFFARLPNETLLHSPSFSQPYDEVVEFCFRLNLMNFNWTVFTRTIIRIKLRPSVWDAHREHISV